MANRLLHRDVVKLVTPGTLLEPLHHHANYLMAIAVGPTLSSALAWLDLSTSDFQVRNLAINNVHVDVISFKVLMVQVMCVCKVLTLYKYVPVHTKLINFMFGYWTCTCAIVMCFYTCSLHVHVGIGLATTYV